MKINKVEMKVKPTPKKSLKWLMLSAIVISLSGCASFQGPAYKLAQNDDDEFTKPLRAPKNLEQNDDDVLVEQSEEAEVSKSSLVIVPPPTLTVSQAAEAVEQLVVPQLNDVDVARQSYKDLPIPVFINEVYGNQLGLNFIIQPEIKKAPDLVTLRLSSPMSHKDFYVLATKTLANYGVSTFEQGGVLVFDYSAQAAGDDTPIILSGRALPEVPSSNRPVFQIYPLTALKTPDVRGVLTQMFSRNELDVKEDISRNALLIKGKANKVREAVSALQLLDRPSMASMNSVILEPVINSAQELSDSLFAILNAQGFEIKNGDNNTPVRLLPLETTGQVIAFAKDQQTLDYIVEWAKKLETQRESEIKNGLFSYQVQSTKASHIVSVLSQLGLASNVSGLSSTNTQNSGQSTNNQSNFTQNNNTNGTDQASGRYAVDEMLNTILFKGSGKDWADALTMIKRLDKPAPSVMVEVILAEVTLDESEESAIEWLFNSSLGAYDAVGSTLGALGATEGGFNFSLSSGSSTRATLNFLYENSRAKIRSRPRVMVKSGESASIDVGDRIPTITSNVQSTTSSDAQIIQTVTYQETGVLLDVTPTVHASGFVDLEVSQEISEVSADSYSDIDSPTISSRSIETVLTLRDGGSVLIGGLIRSNSSEGEVGVPVLGKLPILGNLFKGDNSSNQRTELMIMIIPYILSSPDEAESLSDELQKARLKTIEEF